jgi:hypothetical protein
VRRNLFRFLHNFKSLVIWTNEVDGRGSEMIGSLTLEKTALYWLRCRRVFWMMQRIVLLFEKTCLMDRQDMM